MEKIKFKTILLKFLLIIVIFVMAFFYSFAFLNIFHKLNILSDNKLLWGSLGIAILVIIIVYVYMFINIKSNKKTRFGNWVTQNTYRFILYYVISYIFFVSFRVEVTYDVSELKNIISLCWTILSISITIFLVWNVLILQYLKKKQPQKNKNMGSIQKYIYIDQKRKFFDSASTLFSTITLLTINLFALAISTSIVHIVNVEVPVLKQNIVLLSFYLSINTIFQLFIDILVPLTEEKKLILKDMKATAEDVNLQNEIDDKLEKTEIAIKEIEKLNNIDAEQKNKIIRELLSDFMEDKGW